MELDEEKITKELFYFLEIHPLLNEIAQIKYHKLILLAADGIQITIDLKCCSIKVVLRSEKISQADIFLDNQTIAL